MKLKLGELGTSFALGLEALGLGFDQMPVPRDFYSRTEMVFVNFADQIWQVVVLVPDVKRMDRFTVEVGWSVLQRVPQLGMRPSPIAPSAALDAMPKEYVCRLSEINLGRDLWWPILDQASSSVAPALEMFVEAGLPYLRAAALEVCSRGERAGPVGHHDD